MRCFTNTSDGEIPDSTVGRDFYVPSTIPIGSPAADEGTDLNAHVKQSRVNFGTDTILGRRRQAVDAVRDRLLRLGHRRPAHQQHLRARAAPCLRHLARVAGRPDLVELHGRRHAARGGGLHRHHGRHDLRAPAAGALHEGRLLDVRRESRDHDPAVLALPAWQAAASSRTTACSPISRPAMRGRASGATLRSPACCAS